MRQLYNSIYRHKNTPIIIFAERTFFRSFSGLTTNNNYNNMRVLNKNIRREFQRFFSLTHTFTGSRPPYAPQPNVVGKTGLLSSPPCPYPVNERSNLKCCRNGLGQNISRFVKVHLLQQFRAPFISYLVELYFKFNWSIIKVKLRGSF